MNSLFKKSDGSKDSFIQRPSPCRSKRSQTLVEFSLIMPMFLVFFLTFIEFSRMTYTRQQLVHAVREGGRFAEVGGTNYGGVNYPSVQSAVMAVIANNSAGLLTTNWNATYNQYTNTTPHWYIIRFSNSSTTNANVGVANSTFTIRVLYRYDYITPLDSVFNAVLGGTMSNRFMLTSSATFVSEKYNDQF